MDVSRSVSKSGRLLTVSEQVIDERSLVARLHGERYETDSVSAANDDVNAIYRNLEPESGANECVGHRRRVGQRRWDGAPLTANGI